MGTVAVYRSTLLPASETFIRDEALALHRYRAVFAGRRREPGLALPDDRILVAPDLPRYAAPAGRLVPALRPEAALARACRRHGVDLVHAHFGPDGVEALDVSRRLRVPLIVTFRGYDASMSDDALRETGASAYVRRRQELFDEAFALTAVSRFLADELHRQGAPRSKLVVHNMGVPVGPERTSFGSDAMVLFVGRLVEKKGVVDLLAAMEAVQRREPAARLVLVGDGPLREDLAARARAAGVRAEFAGWRTPEGVRELMLGARVLCVPSRRAASGDAEGLPTVLLEAGAVGLPVVGTRHSGIPDVIGAGRGGLLVDEGDVAGLADALARALGDEELWMQLSDRAIETVRVDFDPARQVAELEALYDRAIGR